MVNKFIPEKLRQSKSKQVGDNEINLNFNLKLLI